jgi:hypothetical protein
MHISNPHNLNKPVPPQRSYGLRISLRPGDPFAKLVGSDWNREHWFATERERDIAMADMSSRYPFFRIGDEPALVFEKTARQHERR